MKKYLLLGFVALGLVAFAPQPAKAGVAVGISFGPGYYYPAYPGYYDYYPSYYYYGGPYWYPRYYYYRPYRHGYWRRYHRWHHWD